MKNLLFLFTLLFLAFPALADDFVAEGESGKVEPVLARLSDEERQLENSTDLDFIENETKLKDLPCDDNALISQVREFILQNTLNQNLRSVADKRSRLLLVKNLHKFEETDDEAVKESFETSAALVNLRVNDGRNIAHICVSRGNDSKKFANVYVLIYQDLNRYKVTVTNLMKTPSSIDEATFTYSDKK